MGVSLVERLTENFWFLGGKVRLAKPLLLGLSFRSLFETLATEEFFHKH